MKKNILVATFVTFIGSCFFIGNAIADSNSSQHNYRQGRCSPDSEEVGGLCVDKYEVSVWETSHRGLIRKIINGRIKSEFVLMRNAVRRGDNVNDYDEAGCPVTAEGCTNIYAVSVPDIKPSNFANWFQAAAACRNSGKRLLTNGEWQMAVLGTPDTGGKDDFATTCNTDSGEDPDAPPGFPNRVPSGSRNNCVSDCGIFDMVGNLWEWVADWVPRSNTWNLWPEAFGGNDMGLAGAREDSQTPGAILRGRDSRFGERSGPFAITGTFSPTQNSQEVGFRCVR